jgi:hypothetical protein
VIEAQQTVLLVGDVSWKLAEVRVITQLALEVTQVQEEDLIWF